MCNSAALAKHANCEVADLKSLPDDHPVWDLAAHYLACLCANLILTVSPERIVLSGGVLLRLCLFPKIRAKTQEYLNGYIDVPQVTTAEVRWGVKTRKLEDMIIVCHRVLFIRLKLLFSSFFSFRATTCVHVCVWPRDHTLQGIAKLIVPSKHGNAAGMVGALFLGSKALEDSKEKVVPAPAEEGSGGGPLSALQPYSTFLVGLASGLALAGVAMKMRK